MTRFHNFIPENCQIYFRTIWNIRYYHTSEKVSATFLEKQSSLDVGASFIKSIICTKYGDFVYLEYITQSMSVNLST